MYKDVHQRKHSFTITEKVENFKMLKKNSMIKLWHNHMVEYYIAIKNTS